MSYILKTEFVRSSLQTLIEESIHRMFPGYLCLQQQASVEDRLTGLQFPAKSFFDAYFRVDEDSDKPYFVPFNNAKNPSINALWNNENVSGTYAPSSLRSTAPLMHIVEVEKAGHNSKWGMKPKHWELARHHLCGGEQLPVESLAAYLFRDFAFDVRNPKAFTLVEAFTKEFGYEFGGEAFSHLFHTGDSNITEESFEKHD